MMTLACENIQQLPPYPWQQRQWQQFLAYQQMGRLPHALLLLGQAGLGKSAFARALAQQLLCQKNHAINSTSASGTSCTACQLLQAGTHPDFSWLAPEENSQSIKIEQVRTCIDNLTKTAQLQGHKIAVFADAAALNSAAYNALLKTLEEPSGHTCLILIAEDTLSLPATLRSRCQALYFNPPALDLAKQWLSQQVATPCTADSVALALYLANGSPLSAYTQLTASKLTHRQTVFKLLLQLAQDHIGAVTAAAQWPQQVELKEGLEWLLQWLIALVRYQYGLALPDLLKEEITQIIQALPQPPANSTLFYYLDHLYDLRIQLRNKANINPLLAQEKLLIIWQKLGQGALQ